MGMSDSDGKTTVDIHYTISVFKLRPKMRENQFKISNLGLADLHHLGPPVASHLTNFQPERSCGFTNFLKQQK